MSVCKPQTTHTRTGRVVSCTSRAVSIARDVPAGRSLVSFHLIRRPYQIYYSQGIVNFIPLSNCTSKRLSLCTVPGFVFRVSCLQGYLAHKKQRPPISYFLLTGEPRSAATYFVSRVYSDTLLIRNSGRLGPYSRTMPRALWLPEGGGIFLMSEVPL